MPIASPWMKPKNVKIAPASANAAGLVEFAVDDEHRDRAQDDAGERRAAAERLQPLIEHADLRELVEADRGRAGARGAERVVDLRLAPGGDLRQQRQHDRRRVAMRRFLERLRADQHADVEQDRQDRDDRDQRHHQRDDAEPGQHQHDDAGHRGIADAAAHRLPAGMADIDGVDERIAEQAADQADDAVGGQHPRGREGIAGGRGALDVVHRLDQIIDAERDRGDQDDAEILEAGEDVADRRDREREAEVATPSRRPRRRVRPP